MKTQKPLNQFSKGEGLEHFLLVQKLEVKTYQQNKSYLFIELRDESTSMNANIWDNIEPAQKIFKQGEVVYIEGTVEEYKGSLQIKISKYKLPKPSDEVSVQDFLPKSKRSLKEMEIEFHSFIDELKNEFLKKLLQLIFSEEIFSKYKAAPAGKAWHHAYLHGLIEHSLEMAKICKLVSTFHAEVDRDLVIAGALLHDIGKIEELNFSAAFEYSEKGKLLGHIMIGASIVAEAAAQINNFPEILKNELLHLILSHQGKLENASPVVPKSLEAIILYHADELSAQTNAYKSALNSSLQPDSNWTKYLPLISTEIYRSSFITENRNENKSLID